MAFSIKITGVPRDNANPLWSIDNFHYPVYKLREDPLFRLSMDSTLYADYVAVLNTEEALVLHEKYRLDPSGKEQIKNENELLFHLKKGPPETRWVIFEIYEWESGL